MKIIPNSTTKSKMDFELRINRSCNKIQLYYTTK